MYTVAGSVGDSAIGVFQLKRSLVYFFRSSGPSFGWMSRVSCVCMLTRPMVPPWASAYR